MSETEYKQILCMFFCCIFYIYISNYGNLLRIVLCES